MSLFREDPGSVFGATDSSGQSPTLLTRQVPQKCRFGPTKKFRSFKAHFCPAEISNAPPTNLSA